MSCRYVIRRKGSISCGVRWTILRFDLASPSDPEDCRGDSLRIEAQTLCGRLRRGAEGKRRFASRPRRERVAFNSDAFPGFTPFRSDAIGISFESGDGRGSSGFLIKGKQTEACLPHKPFPGPAPSSVPCSRYLSISRVSLVK